MVLVLKNTFVGVATACKVKVLSHAFGMGKISLVGGYVCLCSLQKQAVQNKESGCTQSQVLFTETVHIGQKFIRQTPSGSAFMGKRDGRHGLKESRTWQLGREDIHPTDSFKKSHGVLLM